MDKPLRWSGSSRKEFTVVVVVGGQKRGTSCVAVNCESSHSKAVKLKRMKIYKQAFVRSHSRYVASQDFRVMCL